jgi:hypothetical protein
MSALPIENLLEHWLSIRKPGAYTQAAPEAQWAFEPLANMWSEEVYVDSSNNNTNDNEDTVQVPSTPETLTIPITA